MCPVPCLMTVDPPSGSGERSTASAPPTGIHPISTCAVHSLAATNTVVGRCTERRSRLAVPSLSATAWTQVLSGNNTKACAPASGALSRRTVMTPAPPPEDGSATVFVPQTPEPLAARERAASPECSCLLGLAVGASFPQDWIFDRRPRPHLAHGRTMAPTHRLTAGIIAATTAPTTAPTTDVTSAGSSSIARTLFGLCRPSAPSGVGLTRGKSSHDLNLTGLRVGSGVPRRSRGQWFAPGFPAVCSLDSGRGWKRRRMSGSISTETLTASAGTNPYALTPGIHEIRT